MRVHLGSPNPVKLAAVKEVLALYPRFAGAEVIGMDVDSGVGAQPQDLEETIQGAMNRAKACIEGADFSVGIEGGILPVPQTPSGAAKIEACVIYDGQKTGLGFSCAYVIPEDVHRIVVEQHVDMSEALRLAGKTTHEKIGTAGGGIGLLTDGRMQRIDMCKQALITALINVEK